MKLLNALHLVYNTVLKWSKVELYFMYCTTFMLAVVHDSKDTLLLIAFKPCLQIGAFRGFLNLLRKFRLLKLYVAYFRQLPSLIKNLTYLHHRPVFCRQFQKHFQNPIFSYYRFAAYPNIPRLHFLESWQYWVALSL